MCTSKIFVLNDVPLTDKVSTPHDVMLFEEHTIVPHLTYLDILCFLCWVNMSIVNIRSGPNNVLQRFEFSGPIFDQWI